MIIDFYQWLISSGTNEQMRNFRAGYVWGAFVVLLLLLAVKILHYYLFCRQKKVHEIRIPGERGALFIASGAVADMVKFVGAKFSYIDIAKVSLIEGKYGITMDINITYDMHGDRLPVIVDELQTALRENLAGRLGLDSIKFIDIHSKKITDNKNSRF